MLGLQSVLDKFIWIEIPSTTALYGTETSSDLLIPVFRVLPTMKLDEVREEIHEQLGLDNVPLTFVFLRSVGRNFTQVRHQQIFCHMYYYLVLSRSA